MFAFCSTNLHSITIPCYGINQKLSLGESMSLVLTMMFFSMPPPLHWILYFDSSTTHDVYIYENTSMKNIIHFWTTLQKVCSVTLHWYGEGDPHQRWTKSTGTAMIPLQMEYYIGPTWCKILYVISLVFIFICAGKLLHL